MTRTLTILLLLSALAGSGQTVSKVKTKSPEQLAADEWRKIAKRLPDSIVTEIYYDTTVCALYVMKCDSCEPVIQAAFKVHKRIDFVRWGRVLELKTGQIHGGMGVVDKGGQRFVKYLRYDKSEFDKPWIILQEKILN